MAEITQEELAQIITAALADSVVKALPAPGSSIDLFAKVPDRPISTMCWNAKASARTA